jgi:hypothetical protein
MATHKTPLRQSSNPLSGADSQGELPHTKPLATTNWSWGADARKGNAFPIGYAAFQLRRPHPLELVGEVVPHHVQPQQAKA